MKNGWEWRCAHLDGEDGASYILVAMCKPAYSNWKAILIKHTTDGAAVVGRLEDHPSHKGLHIHAHCDRGGVETGPSGMDGLIRIPEPQAWNRRTEKEWTQGSFWARARTFFRVVDSEPDGQMSLAFGERP